MANMWAYATAIFHSRVISSPEKIETTTPNIVVVPFRLSGGLIIIKAEINGEQGDFILDSGAPFLVLNQQYFPNLGSQNGSQQIQSFTGGGEARIAFIRQFMWAQRLEESLRCNVANLSHLESKDRPKILGLIGFELFRSVELFIDYEEKRLVVYKLDENGEAIERDADYSQPQHEIEFEVIGHACIVNGNIAGQKMRFAIDTGAELNALNKSAPDKVLVDFTRLRELQLRGAAGADVPTWFGRVNSMKIGEVEYPGLPMLLVDIQNARSTFGTPIDGFLGTPFLRMYRTVINFKKRRLYVWDYAQ